MAENVMTDSIPDNKTRRIGKKSSRERMIDGLEESDNYLPALADEVDGVLGKKLEKIEKQVGAILEKQSTGVSAEFNALMDGYVNKANQSQEYKVKYEHLETVHEDLKIEAKTLREENKKFKSDAEAAREALRMSELDLQRNKKESDNAKLQYEEQVSNLIEERERLKAKVKQLTDKTEKSSQEYNDLKAELLEHKYRAKQLEQEKQVELETQKRSIRETNKIIEELKEKLDLRTREVEYKDALLNQLIKQVSADESYNNAGASSSFTTGPAPAAPENFKVKPKPNLELNLEDDGLGKPSEGSSWGAFRR